MRSALKTNIPSPTISHSLKQELERSSDRFHIIGAYIAVIFNPIFGYTDYINIPENWTNVFIIRVFISVITLSLLLLKKKIVIPSYIVILVPFFLISLQNAYTFRFIGNDHVLGHCLNYIALFIGAGMFVLWRWPYSIMMVILSILTTAFFVNQNQGIDIKTFFLEGGLLLIVVSLFMIILIRTRYRLTVNEIIAKLKLKESNDKLEIQTEKTEQKHKSITESITYAKRIQDSILGSAKNINGIFKNSFILYKPKDILSGDFYYCYESPNGTKVIIAADCTGHGVPAALMTVLGINTLKEIIEQSQVFDPGKILNLLDRKIHKALLDEDSTFKIHDGMDISVITFTENKMQFAGAMNPIAILKKGQELERIKSTRASIRGAEDYCNIFETYHFDIETGDKIYLYSDGYQDQYGGPESRKYLSKVFRRTLSETSNLSMKEQGIKLNDIITNWKGDVNQTDDILVIGIEV